MVWKVGGLIFVGAIVAVWLIKAPLLASYISDKLGLDISVRTMSVWPKHTTMGHFRIANPYGFQGRTALAVKKAIVDYRWKALPEEIDLITLNDVFLNIDIRGSNTSDNNWTALGAQMPRNRTKQRVVVHKLVINNLVVKTEGKGAKSLGVAGTKQFDRMEFNEIDSQEGFPTKELISQIFQGAGLRIFIQKFVDPAMQIQKALSPFKLFGENEKTPEGDLEGAKS